MTDEISRTYVNTVNDDDDDDEGGWLQFLMSEP